MNRTTLTHIITIIGLCALSAFGYFLATKQDFFKSSLVTAEQVQKATEEAQKDVIAFLDMLEDTELRGELFTLPAYTQLVDRNIQLAAPVLARPNPFLPLNRALVVPVVIPQNASTTPTH